MYPKKYAHGFCFAVLCCGYTWTAFPISIRLTSLALGQSNDCLSASKATLMDMDKYFMWIHYERLHNHNKAKHNKNVCIFLGIYCRQWHDSDYVRYLKIKQTTHFHPLNITQLWSIWIKNIKAIYLKLYLNITKFMLICPFNEKKWKNCQLHNFLVMDDRVSCHYNNLGCYQRWKVCLLDDLLFSVMQYIWYVLIRQQSTHCSLSILT